MAKQNLSTARRIYKLNKEWDFCVEGTVCNGFPVIMWFNIDAADPEVGYFHDSISEYELTTPAGSPATWLKASDRDIDNLKTAGFEAVAEAAEDNFNEPDEDY